MYVGIEDYSEADSANISAANMAGKDHNIGSEVMYVQMVGFGCSREE
jgi:hypothetical protein